MDKTFEYYEPMLKHLAGMCQKTQATLIEHQQAQNALSEIAKYMHQSLTSGKGDGDKEANPPRIKELENPAKKK